MNKDKTLDIRITENDLHPSFTLPGVLSIPEQSEIHGTVIFAHGSGSSRWSPRNQKVARILNQSGLITLLFDLLVEDETQDLGKVFDIPLLASRLQLATHWTHDWLTQNKALFPPEMGYFGASTGAAAALWAAAQDINLISAVVSRGGRPDLASSQLHRVQTPTLLLVGGDDTQVLALNQQALKLLPQGELLVIPGAGHLFEEHGALEEVSRQASWWLTHHFQKRQAIQAVA